MVAQMQEPTLQQQYAINRERQGGLYASMASRLSQSVSPPHPAAHPPSASAIPTITTSSPTPLLPPLVHPPSSLSPAAANAPPFQHSPQPSSAALSGGQLMAYFASRAGDSSGAAVRLSIPVSSSSSSSAPHQQPRQPPHSPPPPQSQPPLQPPPSAQLPSHQQSASAAVAVGSQARVRALLLPYEVTRRILNSWPDTVHQFEKETGVCFDLAYFSSLLSATDYSAASDYLVSFWIHPFYRTTLSRTDHSRVRHALVSLMELKLALLSMTTDRLMLEFFIEKELKPKLMSLSLDLFTIEELVRKAFCNVRVRYAVPVQSLRHTVWYELARTAESEQQRLLEVQVLAQFLKEPSIMDAHRHMAREVRAMPFHFAPANHTSTAVQLQRQPPRSRGTSTSSKSGVVRENSRETSEEARRRRRRRKRTIAAHPPRHTSLLSPPPQSCHPSISHRTTDTSDTGSATSASTSEKSGMQSVRGGTSDVLRQVQCVK